MKRMVLVLFAFVFSVTAMAQLYALSMNGKVQIQRNGKWQNVFVGEELQRTDLVQTEEFGYFVILDRATGKKYSFQAHEAQTIEQLILMKSAKTPSLAKEVVQGLCNILMGRKDYIDKNNNTGGVTYRDLDEDFLVASILKTQPQTSYLIDFMLLDMATMQPVKQVYEGQYIIFQINNHSDTPLNVNIIDKEPNGKQSAIFKGNEMISYQDLYIPAFSSVQLMNYPIKFAPANTIDQLTLVAYPLPFNLSKVLEPMSEDNKLKNTNNVNEPIGIYQMNVPIIPAGSY